MIYEIIVSCGTDAINIADILLWDQISVSVSTLKTQISHALCLLQKSEIIMCVGLLTRTRAVIVIAGVVTAGTLQKKEKLS